MVKLQVSYLPVISGYEWAFRLAVKTPAPNSGRPGFNSWLVQLPDRQW